MKNKLFVGSGVAFLSLFLACLLNLLLMSFGLKIVDMFVATDYFAQNVIRLVISVISISGIIGAVRYLVSYRTADFSISVFSSSYFVAAFFQLLVSVLLKFHPIIAGGSLYLAGIFEFGSAFSSSDDIDYIGLLDYLAAFVLLTLVTYAIGLLLGIIGKNKRLKDRSELIGENK